MKTAGLIMGILAICGMLLAFIPCLGAFNWLNIPFATIGLIISIIAYTGDKTVPKGNNALAGIIMCAIAMIFGFFRLIIGGGIV
ncbi:MAG: hypothetical protein ACK5IC_11175 [Moheibacter sp.]